jgi:hypothetical protein
MKSNRYSRQILMKLDFSRQSFDKYSNIEFHENLSSGSRVFHTDERTNGRTDEQKDGQTDGRTNGRMDERMERRTDRQTDMTQIIVAFRNLRTRLKIADLFAISYSLYRQYFVVSLPKL